MRRKLLLAYEGTDFSGWQIQDKPNPPPTIQETLESALRKLTGEKIRITASGRTDAGVHAHGQVAHFDYAGKKLDRIPNLQKTLNAILPQSIRILQAEVCKPDFHARRNAVAKTYVYQFWQDNAFIPPALLNWTWPCGKIDKTLFCRTASLFEGTHDFATFQNSGADQGSTVRTVYSVLIREVRQISFYPAHAPMLCLEITANGFLKQMVRNIAGFIVQAARNKIDPACFKDVIKKASRKYLPSPTAPAKGLALARVHYGKPLDSPYLEAL